jgi:CubicO group peptidase (beta-lactamase class C family)
MPTFACSILHFARASLAAFVSRAARLAWASIGLLCVATAGAQAVYPADRWEQLAPAASGWSAEKLRSADDAARSLGSDAVLVVHRGVVVHEFGDTTRPMNLYSVRKSVLSMLIGIHVARGELRLDATLAELGIDDKQGLSTVEKTATVRQLLLARSGVYHPAAYETARMAAARPARGSHAPGTFWYYNNWDFNALGSIFHQRTGRTVFEALDAELARPLQFEHFQSALHTRFHHDSASEHPAYIINLSARDLARLGLLMARAGRWGERQIVPAHWVAESTAPHSLVAPGWSAYGYMWWVPQRAWPFWTRSPGDLFLAEGNYAQVMFVDRARDLVVVHRVDGSRWFAPNHDVGQLSPLLGAIIAALPPS